MGTEGWNRSWNMRYGGVRRMGNEISLADGVGGLPLRTIDGSTDDNGLLIHSRQCELLSVIKSMLRMQLPCAIHSKTDRLKHSVIR